MALLKPGSISFLLIVACLAVTASMKSAFTEDTKQDVKSITATIALEYHEVCYIATVSLKNETEEPITVRVGAGGSGRAVAPTFFVGSLLSIKAPQYLRYQNRAMRPEFLVLAPKAEVVYKSYTMGYPPVRDPGEYEYSGQLHFYGERGGEYIVYSKPVKLKVPVAAIKEMRGTGDK